MEKSTRQLCKRKKKSLPSGSEATSRCEYVYYRKLQFLQRSTAKRKTASICDGDSTCTVEEDNEDIQITNEDIAAPPANRAGNQ